MSLSQIIDPVIVCGDAAPLVWPPSCKSFPKRFSHLRGSESCFLASVKRAVGEECADPPIMTDESFRFLGIGQLAAMEDAPSRILTRPRPTHGCGCPARCAVICQNSDAVRAATMVASLSYLWSAGFFLVAATALIGALEKHMHDIWKRVSAELSAAKPDLGFSRLAGAN